MEEPVDFNPGPSFCEVAALTAAPQCRHRKYNKKI